MTTLREVAEAIMEQLKGGWVCESDPVAQDLKAALAEPVQEPVAWYSEARHIDSAWAAAVTLKHPGPEGKYMRKVTPLYTAPPQRKPLTDEEIDRITDQQWAANNHKPIYAAHRAYARAIERAHGIK